MDETQTPPKKRMSKPKTPSDRMKKYHKARLEGHNKEQSKAIAGYSPNTLTTTIEASDTYKRVSIGEQIEREITTKEIIAAHADNIRQDKDLGARNAAIKMAYERIEPDNEAPEQAERVIVILK